MKKDLAEVKAYAEAITGGRGGVTQGVNWEFIESF